MPKYCFPKLSSPEKGYVVSPSFIVDKRFYDKVSWLDSDPKRSELQYPVYHVNNVTPLSHLILLEYVGEK